MKRESTIECVPGTRGGHVLLKPFIKRQLFILAVHDVCDPVAAVRFQRLRSVLLARFVSVYRHIARCDANEVKQ